MFNYFNEKEIKNLSLKLVQNLDLAREVAGIPFYITSGYRNEIENKKVGGVSNSSHLKGLAVDLRCDDSVSRYLILQALFMVGFKRIGIAKDHIHVDIDSDKPQYVFFIE